MKNYENSKHRRDHSQWIGQKFNYLTIERILDELSNNGSVMCEARCDCGNLKTAPLAYIRSGRLKSCGCKQRELIGESRSKDLTGRVFRRLTVLYKTGRKYSDGSNIWHCRCECGREIDAVSHLLLNGTVSSCGECGYLSDRVREANTVYGSSEDKRLAHIFNGMQQRCENPNSKDFSRYGGRGISICPEWKNNTPEFVKWGMSHGYKPGLTIERINVNGPYSPDNCTFIPMRDQALNRRTNMVISVNGSNYSRKECSEVLGIPMTTLKHRTPEEIKEMMLNRLGES